MRKREPAPTDQEILEYRRIRPYLLKMLEEPGDRTYFLLVTHRPASLPATVRSRCRMVPVPVPGARELQAWLCAETGIAPADAASDVRPDTAPEARPDVSPETPAGDCRTTGCQPGNKCEPCKAVNGVVYVCLSNGIAC